MQLKSDMGTDGKVLGSTGKAKSNIEWTEGNQRDQTTEQSSKFICIWRVTIAEIGAAVISSDVVEDEMEPTNHPEPEKNIEAHAISLESKVCLLKLAFWSLL